MSANRLSIVILTLVLVLAMVLTVVPGCAPKEEPVPSHETVNIQLYGGSLGGISYFYSFGLADLINKNHPWLRATAVETTGSIENVKTIIDQPEMKTVIFPWSASTVYDILKLGVGPFKDYGPYKDLKVVCKGQWLFGLIFTLDPDIKTFSDFAGKKLNIGLAGSAESRDMEAFIKAAGLEGKIEVTQMGRVDARDALIDGLIDGLISNLMGSGVGGKEWSAFPADAELLASKKVYAVGFEPELVQKQIDLTKARLIQAVVPAKALEGFPEKETPSYAMPLGWYADIAMDEEIVQEVLRIQDEHASKFVEYSAQLKTVTPDMLGNMPYPEEDFHPGAVKYFKENGIKIGID